MVCLFYRPADLSGLEEELYAGEEGMNLAPTGERHHTPLMDVQGQVIGHIYRAHEPENEGDIFIADARYVHGFGFSIRRGYEIPPSQDDGAEHVLRTHARLTKEGRERLVRFDPTFEDWREAYADQRRRNRVAKRRKTERENYVPRTHQCQIDGNTVYINASGQMHMFTAIPAVGKNVFLTERQLGQLQNTWEDPDKIRARMRYFRRNQGGSVWIAQTNTELNGYVADALKKMASVVQQAYGEERRN